MPLQDSIEPSSTGEANDNDDILIDDTVGGVEILAKNIHRKSAMIINVGEETMRVTTDGSAPTATHGKPVVAGGALVLSSPYCPTESVKAIREGASNTFANASEVT